MGLAGGHGMSAGRPEALAGLASLALLGGLGSGWPMAVAGPLLVAAGLLPVALVIAVANPDLRKVQGLRGVLRQLAGGFAFAVPFAVLALVSRIGLGWNGASAFAGAAIATGAGAGGLELVKAGCGRVTGLILPSIAAVLLATAWILAGPVLAGAGS